MSWLAGLLLSTLTVAAQTVPPTWRAEGPEGGPILDLEFSPEDPGVLFVLTRGGEVFRSSDRGDHWIRASMRGPLPPDPQFLSLHRDADGSLSLFSGGHTDGVFVSRDGGDQWVLLSAGTLGEVFVDVAVDASDPQRMIAAQGRRGVARSLDGGQSWHPVAQDVVVSGNFYQYVVQHPFAPETWFVLTNSGHALWSRDFGQTWSVPVGPGSARALAFDPARPDHVVALSNGALHRSRDRGVRWDELPLADSARGGLAVIPALRDSDAAKLCVTIPGLSDPSRIQCTTDLGETWSDLGAALPRGRFHGLYASREGDLYASMIEEGWFRLEEPGWAEMHRGMQATLVRDFLVDPVRPRGLFAATSSALQHRIGRGGWNPVSEDRGGPAAILSLAAASDREWPLVFGTFGGLGRGDGAGTWETVDQAGGFIFWKVRAAQEGNLLFAGGDFTLLRSLDGGSGWEELAAPSIQRIREILVVGDPPTVLVGQESGSVLIRSDDLGVTWESALAGLNCWAVYSLAADPRDPTRLYAGSYCGFYRSEDGGMSWQEVGQGLANDVRIFDLRVDPVEPDTLYAAALGAGINNLGHGRGVWVSHDRGDLWQRLGDIPGNGVSTTLEWVPGGRLWVGTEGSGAYSIALPGIFADGFESGDLSAWSAP